MSTPDRRDFLKTTAVTGAALALSAATYNRVYGANEKLRVGFLGVGGRSQQHIDAVLEMVKQGKPVVPVAVNDVWDGDFELGSKKGRGLYPSAKRCGLDQNDKTHVSKDYRTILDQKDVDCISIATPDHWHARMAIDAMSAGKEVYCEKPMTKTIAEAIAVVDAAQKNNRVMTVGVQSMADPTWHAANEYIRAGKIGHVLQGQTSYYRNYIGGQWRYYPLKKDMTPKTINWDMWLGHATKGVDGEPLGPTPKEMPFDRAVWAQWRCYWPFGGGMYTDLFVHQTTHLITAMGVRFPARVVGGGGLYMEYDGRDVPDVATVVADYDEGCQVIVSATMCNSTQLGEVIRGRLATVRFSPKINGDYIEGFEVYEQKIDGGPGKPTSSFDKPMYTFKNDKYKEGKLKEDENATYALWENFLDCVRSRNRNTISMPELGAAAFSTVNMGVLSYRQGKVFFWDKDGRKPTEADASWSAKWEARSKKRGTPNQIIGWQGGDSGSTMTPPEYQKLAGPWVDGKDPAEASGG